LVAAGASVMATSFSELPAVLVQQETEGIEYGGGPAGVPDKAKPDF